MRKCTCKFVEAGQPMDQKGCKVHTQAHYVCVATGCKDYRPKSAPRPNGLLGFKWPLCVCGEIAQDHN